MNPKYKNIGKMLQTRYIVALTIIAFMVISSQLIIQYALNMQGDDSRIVNIAGRQRMLSQRINKAAFGLYISTGENDRKRYNNELSLSLDLWVKSDYGLQHGSAELGLPGNNTKTVTQMFRKINSDFNNIVTATKFIIDLTSVAGYDKNKLISKISIIQGDEVSFLKGMDTIVFQYDSESKQKVEMTKYIEKAILFITFFTLAMEVMFIFRPAQKQIENSFEEAETNRGNMEKLFETAPSAMLLVDEASFRVMKMNHLAQKIFNVSSDDYSDIDIDNILDLQQANIHELIKLIVSGEVIENLEIMVNTMEHKCLVMLLSSNLIRFNNKRTILLGLSDITRLKEAEEVLKRYATIDEMTQILNKRSGLFVLGNIFDRARDNNRDMSVCFIDIDGLKIVNDTYGHSEGDYYIKIIVQIICNCVSSDDSVFRYGGDEIVIILDNCDRQNAKNVMLRIKNTLEKVSAELGKPYRMSFSYGIASSKDICLQAPDELLKEADKEMYKDKQINRQKQIRQT